MLTMLAVMIIIQSTGFHSQFTFRDGMDGTKRDYQFEDIRTLRGMKTTENNGQSLRELVRFVEEKDLQAEEVVLYGDCPGLSFILDMPFAIGTSWPDLASYPYETFVKDLEELEVVPVVIIRNINTGGEQSIQKKEYLTAFMNSHAYVNVYNNGTYGVYMTQKEVLN